MLLLIQGPRAGAKPGGRGPYIKGVHYYIGTCSANKRSTSHCMANSRYCYSRFGGGDIRLNNVRAGRTLKPVAGVKTML